MSFLGLIANGWFVFLFFLAFVICLIFAIILFLDRKKPSGIVLLVFTVLFLIGAIYSQTHFVVPVNKRVIIIDPTEGKIIGTYDSGLRSKPFFSKKIECPSNTKLEVLIKYLPSVKGGYEVVITFGIYLKSNQIDWGEQYKKYNMSSFEQLAEIWHNQTKSPIAVLFKDCTPQEITAQRKDIEAKALLVFKEYFEKTEGISLDNIQLVNWDFSDSNVRTAFNGAVLAQTKTATAQAEFDATDLKVQRIQKMASGQKIALDELGIFREEEKVKWITIQYLNDLEKPPSNFIFSLGNGVMPDTVAKTVT